jgi:hypothetical protein
MGRLAAKCEFIKRIDSSSNVQQRFQAIEVTKWEVTRSHGLIVGLLEFPVFMSRGEKKASRLSIGWDSIPVKNASV